MASKNRSTQKWCKAMSACALAAVAMSANADGRVNAISDDALVQQWWVVQNACYDAPDGPACAKRDRAAAALESRGYEWHNHDVWTSQSDAGHFNGVVESTDNWAADKSPTMMAMGGPITLKSLRKYLSDEKIIALWNELHASIRDRYPRAWLIIDRQVKQIVADHAGENDPRYTLDSTNDDGATPSPQPRPSLQPIPEWSPDPSLSAKLVNTLGMQPDATYAERFLFEGRPAVLWPTTCTLAAQMQGSEMNGTRDFAFIRWQMAQSGKLLTVQRVDGTYSEGCYVRTARGIRIWSFEQKEPFDSNWQ